MAELTLITETEDEERELNDICRNGGQIVVTLPALPAKEQN